MPVGMPQQFLLQDFGEYIRQAFGHIPYHVGSSVFGKKDWRDVDVRLMLPDKEYEAYGLGDPRAPHNNPRWVLLSMAISELGRKMTGLPIDFQIQDTTLANAEFDDNAKHPRSALYRCHSRNLPVADPPEPVRPEYEI